MNGTFYWIAEKVLDKHTLFIRKLDILPVKNGLEVGLIREIITHQFVQQTPPPPSHVSNPVIKIARWPKMD